MRIALTDTMRISLEGGIGAGKSELLARLRAAGYAVVPEAAEEYFDVLGLFYGDKARYGYLLQTCIIASYAGTRDNAVVERSPYSSLHVFARNQADHGWLHPLEWAALHNLAAQLAWVPDAMIHVRVPPEVSLERARTRARGCEATLDLQYMRDITTANETMVAQYRATGRTILEIDGTQTPDRVFEDVHDWLRSINFT